MKWGWETDKLSQASRVIPWLFGKKLGIIGPDDSGKSTLIKLLIECKLEKSIESTSTRDRHKPIVVKNNNIGKKLVFYYVDDAGGLRENYKVKKDIFKRSKYIIYVVRSEYFLTTYKLDEFVDRSKQLNYITAVEYDFRHFEDWGKKNNFIILGNYFGDLTEKDIVNVDPMECGVPDFSNGDVRYQYLRDFKERINKKIGNSEILKNAEWIVGSLVSGKCANQLISDLLDKLMRVG